MRATYPRRVASLAAAAAAFAALAGSGISLAHETGSVDTVEEHIEEDSVTYTPREARRMEAHADSVTANDAVAAAGAVPPDPGISGQWGPVVPWPAVAIHVALLTNGKVLAYDTSIPDGSDGNQASGESDTYTRATVWDPATEDQIKANVTTGVNIFCSGLAHLTDGRIFIAGGNKETGFIGIRATNVFDSSNNSWTNSGDMAYERWYPSVTPLANGETLITEGHDRADAPSTHVPEVRQVNGQFRPLTAPPVMQDLYPWMDVGPNGRVYQTGPNNNILSLDASGSGNWTSFGSRDGEHRSYGSHAPYDIGKILVAGGGGSQSRNEPPSRTAKVIDLNGSTPQVSATGSMEFPRRQFNLTVLADGTALATGGNYSGASLVDLNAGVYNAELWDPTTGQWTTLAAEDKTRQYHSTALLLPDGRVLSAGGGVCGTCSNVGYLERNAQVFSPPYLFKDDGSGDLAPRPVISSAPRSVAYDAPMSIQTPSAASIGKVALMRLGSVTHSVNMEQRYVPLDYSAAGGQVNARSPLNANIAPPGYYMLFLIGSDGVPSLAEMVRLDPSAPTPPAAPSITATAPASPANDNSPKVIGTAAAGSTVKIYSGADCSGSPLATGTAAAFAAPGIAASVADNTTTNFRATATDSAGNASPCSSAQTYVEVSTASAAPSITATAPASPANDNSPKVIGTAAAGSTVKIYSGADCSGSPLATGTAAAFAAPGITVAVGDDTTTQLRATATNGVGDASPCSSAQPYVEDSTAPAAPSITATAPASPANDNSPKVIGTAAAGSTVKIYSTGDCSGTPLATGTTAQFASPGITAAVGADQTTNLKSTATDAAANTSVCSSAFPYTEDSTAPVAPAITSGPTGPTNDATPTFGFSADAGTTTHCSIDQGTPNFVACSSVHNPTAALADGSYTFRVRATDAAGNQAAATRSFSVDTQATDSTIDFGPSEGSSTQDSTPTFSFTATEGGSAFQCSVDGSSFAACSSPMTLAALSDGSHTFRVRAIDPAGNVDATPGTRSFIVDTVAPQTTFIAGPSDGSSTQDSTPTFSFTSSELGSTFQCRVDSGVWVSCSSPRTLANLSSGSHTFWARAVDRSGNIDATPAARTFTVDVQPPNTTITAGPPNGSTIQGSTPTFSFTSTEAGSIFQCSIDGSSYTVCSSPKTLTAQPIGNHTFRVRAIDPAGNVDATPAARSFKVKQRASSTRAGS